MLLSHRKQVLRHCLYVILYIRRTRLARAIGAAVESVVGLDAVPDDLAPATGTDRGQFVNGALEAVERVARARRRDLEGQVIVVAADFTLRHRHAPLTLVAPFVVLAFAFLSNSTTAV